MIKKSLRFQFFLAYLVIALLTLVLLNTYGHSAIYHKLTEHEKQKLYEEAELIAREYIPDKERLDPLDATLQQHFRSLENLTNMRVWLVSSDGVILMDSHFKNSYQGKDINSCDSSFLTSQSMVGSIPSRRLRTRTAMWS